jgi:uncharacterized protein (TIGR02118 family)
MVARRNLIATSLAGAAATLAGCASGKSQPVAAQSGQVKLTLLHHVPKDPVAFDKHYWEVHIPLTKLVKGLDRVERSKPMPVPNTTAAYHSMTEYWFDSVEQARAVLGSPEYAKVMADTKNFTTTNAITAIFSRVV